MKLFWKEHNPSEVRGYMSVSNQTLVGSVCNYLTCVVSGRHKSESGEVIYEYLCDERLKTKNEDWVGLFF
jgi:hypothetical protein